MKVLARHLLISAQMGVLVAAAPMVSFAECRWDEKASLPTGVS